MTMASTDTGQGASPPHPQSRNLEDPLQENYPPSRPVTTVRPSSSAVVATTNANARAQAVNAVVELPMAHNTYDELSLIGNGAYGTVYLGRDKTNEGRLVALKKIRITLTDEGVPVNALREIALLKQLEKFEHPNIVRLFDICHGRIERDSRLTLILVFEYVEQDLDNFLKNSPPPSLEPLTIKSLMHQVLCGVDFLHTNRIIHRDLKPQNLLVDRFHRVKIADFGLARIYDFHMRLTTTVVTLWYRAPEVLLSNNYATPVDIWSCGCIFAELYRRSPLFQGQTEGDQLQRIFDVIGKPIESEWPKDVSLSIDNFRDHLGRPFHDVVPEITPDGVDLLRNLLKFVPGNRLSAKNALKHPYFRGMSTPRVMSASTRSAPPVRTSLPGRTSPGTPGVGSGPAEAVARSEATDAPNQRKTEASSSSSVAPSSEDPEAGTSNAPSHDISSSSSSSSSSSLNSTVTSSSCISNSGSSCSSSSGGGGSELNVNSKGNNDSDKSTTTTTSNNDENNPNAGNSSNNYRNIIVNNNNNNNNNNNSGVTVVVTSSSDSKVPGKGDTNCPVVSEPRVAVPSEPLK